VVKGDERVHETGTQLTYLVFADLDNTLCKTMSSDNHMDYTLVTQHQIQVKTENKSAHSRHAKLPYRHTDKIRIDGQLVQSGS
jgi:hypothetical protein